MKLLFTFSILFTFFAYNLRAQSAVISGKVISGKDTVQSATVSLVGANAATFTDSLGSYSFKNLQAGNYKIRITAVGYEPATKSILVKENETTIADFRLTKIEDQLGEIVVTGTLRPVSRTASPIPVEVYTPKFFNKNPTPSLFDAGGLINGVRPQLNCNVCNTGDIHINGMEGPYTLILIDGMPIVSALSTVYGLSGIPNSMVERLEVVKGPAAALYGSEAMGGIINVITKALKMHQRLAWMFLIQPGWTTV